MDGTFEVIANLAGPLGKKVTDTGTWSVTESTLILNAKQLGKFVRPITLSGDKLSVVAEELDMTIHFARNK
jgi:hypothetical protein